MFKSVQWYSKYVCVYVGLCICLYLQLYVYHQSHFTGNLFQCPPKTARNTVNKCGFIVAGEEAVHLGEMWVLQSEYIGAGGLLQDLDLNQVIWAYLRSFCWAGSYMKVEVIL